MNAFVGARAKLSVSIEYEISLCKYPPYPPTFESFDYSMKRSLLDELIITLHGIKFKRLNILRVKVRTKPGCVPSTHSQRTMYV